MQLYHHPYSLDSQKVRLALEEKGIDYTSNHVNPITGRNMDASFFRINQSARLPVFQNGSHIIFNTIEIIQYIETPSSGCFLEEFGSRDTTDEQFQGAGRHPLMARGQSNKFALQNTGGPRNYSMTTRDTNKIQSASNQHS